MQISTKRKITEGEEEDYRYRKIRPIMDGASLGVVLPKSYAMDLKISEESYVKIQKEGSKLIIVKA